MYTCPNCWKLTREKVEICSRCKIDINAYEAKKKEEFKNTKINSPKSETEKLNDIIKELREKGKQAVASRDEWRKRAEVAEKELSSRTNNNDLKFRQVKMKFSKMYHPDTVTGDKFEKLIKQEIFKEFWQEIINIENKNS